MAIKVFVRQRNHTKYWLAWWRDESGVERQKSTRQTKRREAERFAARLERELNLGFDARQITLAELRLNFEDQRFPFLREKSAQVYGNVFNQLESFFGADREIRQLNSQSIAKWQAKLKAAGRSDFTIASYLRTVKVLLNWAVDTDVLEKCPKISMPRTAKRGLARGRALTVPEVARALRCCHDVFPNEDVQNWQYIVRGLLYSGLRIGEALELSHDRGPVRYIAGHRPVIKFLAEGQKANRDEIAPVTPHFAKLVAKGTGTGKVFMPTHHGDRVDVFGLSKRISKLFAVANIEVEDDKTATAHDLRRTFGLFWSTRLKPIQLKTLMRHSTIETTLKYYVDLPTSDVSEAIWQ